MRTLVRLDYGDFTSSLLSRADSPQYSRMLVIRKELHATYDTIMDTVGTERWEASKEELVGRATNLGEAHNVLYDELARRSFAMEEKRIPDYALLDNLVRLSFESRSVVLKHSLEGGY